MFEDDEGSWLDSARYGVHTWSKVCARLGAKLIYATVGRLLLSGTLPATASVSKNLPLSIRAP